MLNILVGRIFKFLLVWNIISCSQDKKQLINNQSARVVINETGPAAVQVLDTVDYQARPKFEITEVVQHHDTLSIVSGSSHVIYPFGKFETLPLFLARYPGFIATSKLEDPDSTGQVRVYTLKRGNNLVKLFKLDEERRLEIASGIIIDPNIILVTGIHVGMTKKEFII